MKKPTSMKKTAKASARGQSFGLFIFWTFGAQKDIHFVPLHVVLTLSTDKLFLDLKSKNVPGYATSSLM